MSPCLFFTFYFGSFKLVFLTVVIKFAMNLRNKYTNMITNDIGESS